MNRKIFDIEPTDWRHLEKLVEQSFNEMGYESHRSQVMATVRGNVEIDLYAVNKSSPIPTIVLCECKHWNKPVSQNVVHGFRTVCSDVGAHFGVVISRKGFQSGAELSRKSTNVHLLNFVEFQETFFDEWIRGAFIMLVKMRDQLLPILRAASGMVENGLDTIAGEAIAGVVPFQKYAIFFGVDGAYSNYFIHWGLFPAEMNDPRGHPREVGRIIVRSHREYLEIARQSVSDATNHFVLPKIYFS